MIRIILVSEIQTNSFIGELEPDSLVTIAYCIGWGNFVTERRFEINKCKPVVENADDSSKYAFMNIGRRYQFHQECNRPRWRQRQVPKFLFHLIIQKSKFKNRLNKTRQPMNEKKMAITIVINFNSSLILPPVWNNTRQFRALFLVFVYCVLYSSFDNAKMTWKYRLLEIHWCWDKSFTQFYCIRSISPAASNS